MQFNVKIEERKTRKGTPSTFRYVTDENGKAVCAFAVTPAGTLQYGIWQAAVARMGNDKIFDTDAKQFLVGNLGDMI